MRNILLLLVLVPLFTFAQEKKQPGFVVLNNGDSLKGLVLYKKKYTSEDLIQFEKAGYAKSYSIRDIKVFSVNNMVFERHTISYYSAPIGFTDARENYSDEKDSVITWLNLLIKGRYSLYELQTKERTVYFSSLQDSPPQELIYRVRMRQLQYFEKDETYKELLKTYASTAQLNKSLVKKSATTGYVHDELLRFFLKLNNNNANYAEDRELHIKADIFAGILFNNYKHNDKPFILGTYIFSTNKASYKNNSSASFGLGATFYSNKNLQKILYRLGLEYNSYIIYGEYNTSQGTYTKETYDIKINMIDVAGSIDFKIAAAGKNTVYAGPYAGFSRSLTKKIKSTLASNTSSATYDEFPYLNAVYGKFGGSVSISGTWGKAGLSYYTSSNLFSRDQAKLVASGFRIGYSFYFRFKQKTSN